MKTIQAHTVEGRMVASAQAMIRSLVLISTCILVMPSLAEAKEPLQAVKGMVEAIRELEVPPEGGALTPAQAASNRARVERAHALLDLEGLAASSLGGAWANLGAGQRSDFVDLLKDLLAKVAYPQSSRFFTDLELEMSDGGERGGRQRVIVEVRHPDEGLIELDFFLVERGSTWVVVDIHLDGASLAANIRSQIRKTFESEGYDGLTKKMKARISEAE